MALPKKPGLLRMSSRDVNPDGGGLAGSGKHPRIQKRPSLGVRSALATFASHLAPPAHADVAGLASPMSDTMSTWSRRPSFSGSPSLSGRPSFSRGASFARPGRRTSYGHAFGHQRGRSSGGWMLAEDEHYLWAYPRPGDLGGDVEDDDQPDDSDTNSVHNVVVDSEFKVHKRNIMEGSGSGPEEEEEAQDVLAAQNQTTAASRAGVCLRDNLLVPLLHYVDSRFPDQQMERQFTHERWAAEKSNAMVAACFLVLEWLLFAALQRNYTVFQYYSYVSLVGFFTLPLPIMVGFDGPRRFQWLYQPFVLVATWSLGFCQLIEARLCHFQEARNTCQPNAFIYLIGYLYGLPTIASIGLWGHRVLAVFGAVTFLVLMLSLFDSTPESNATWSLGYWRERADRQMFLMRQKLKARNNDLQVAQIMERRAEHSKKQFVSYIFHEVRVPLNTAMLAVQNLKGEGVFRRLDQEEGIMMHGLTSSLGMMEKVLNDVLSFNRMQSGQLTQARKPFNFHKSISVVALAHRQQGSNVKLSIELDPHIDNVGLLVGDETRLRQITSNLLSNALKFTSEGTVTLITRLISAPPEEGWHDEKDPRGLQCRTVPASLAQTPCLLSDQVFNGTQPIMSCSAKSPPTSDSPSTNVEARNTGRLLNEKKRTTPTTPDSSSSDSTTGQRYATVRVEVQDSGAGLRGADLVDNRLFSPYVQTEIGRRQGGKGSGLGLALVMQLVKLSKGRLGVDSKLGVGSTFWFELQYPIYDEPAEPAPLTSTTSPSYSPVGMRLSSPHRRFGAFPFGERSSSARGARRFSAPEPSTHRSDTAVTLNRLTEMRHSAWDIEIGDRPELDPSGSTSSSLSEAPLTVFATPPSDSPEPEHPVAVSKPDQDFVPPTMPIAASARRESFQWTPDWDLAARSEPHHPFASVESPRTVIQPSKPQLPAHTADLAPRDEGLTMSKPLTPSPSTKPPAPSRSRSHRVPPPLDLSTQALPPALRRPTRMACPRAPPVGDGLQALVVDDDALTRRLMTRMLTRLGAEVKTAENGKLALEEIAHNMFDIVFLDNQMPVMSGIEAVQALRASGNRRQFVVGCTGNALEEDQAQYLVAGANAILPKPVHQKDLEAKLTEVHDRRAQGHLNDDSSSGDDMDGC